MYGRTEEDQAYTANMSVPPSLLASSNGRPMASLRRTARSGADLDAARSSAGAGAGAAKSTPDASFYPGYARNPPAYSASEDVTSIPPPPPPRPLVMPAASGNRNSAFNNEALGLRPQPIGQESASISRRPTTAAAQKHGFHAQQAAIFACFYIGYMCYVLNQKSFLYALPFVVVQEYITTYELGLIFSALSLAIALSRPVASLVCDNYSVRLLFSIGLFISGLVCLAFVDSDTLLSFTTTALMNGLAQGFGWTPVVKTLRQWFHWQMFGTLWAAMATAENVANAIGHPLSAHLASGHSWKLAIQVPALASMLTAAVVYLLASDKPSECGFPDDTSNVAAFSQAGGHWSDLLSAPFMWILAAGSMTMACVVTSIRDWAHGYLVNEQSMPLYTAHGFLTAMEVGGVIGSILSGVASDALVKSETPSELSSIRPAQPSAPRMVLIQVMIASTAVCLNILLFAITGASSFGSIIVLALFTGFSVYGATSLIAIVAAETARVDHVGAAQAIVFLSSSVGGFMSAVPIVTIANYYSWFNAVAVLEIICIAAFMTMVLTKNMPATFTLLAAQKNYPGRT